MFLADITETNNVVLTELNSGDTISEKMIKFGVAKSSKKPSRPNKLDIRLKDLPLDTQIFLTRGGMLDDDDDEDDMNEANGESWAPNSDAILRAIRWNGLK